MATTIERETAPTSPGARAPRPRPLRNRQRQAHHLHHRWASCCSASWQWSPALDLQLHSTFHRQRPGGRAHRFPSSESRRLRVRGADRREPLRQAGDTLVVLDDRDYKRGWRRPRPTWPWRSRREQSGAGGPGGGTGGADAGQRREAACDLERTKPLAEKEIMPKPALDAAEAGARAADAALAAAQAALLGADARVAAAARRATRRRMNLSYTQIIAPADGACEQEVRGARSAGAAGPAAHEPGAPEDVWPRRI